MISSYPPLSGRFVDRFRAHLAIKQKKAYFINPLLYPNFIMANEYMK